MTDAERASASIIVKITPSEKDRFAKLVQENCINQSALIRKLVMEWVEQAEAGHSSGVKLLPAQSALSRSFNTNPGAGQLTVWNGPEDDS